jgi:cytochrome c biogenesis protein CcmG/thiol:disulfide interchange protein DsbE
MKPEYCSVRTIVQLSEHSPDLPRRNFLLGALGLGIVASGGLFAPSAKATDLKLGQPAPPLVLHTLDGKSIATRDLLGQVVIATFWATWCEPCLIELPLLSDYSSRHAQEGLQVLGFSLDNQENLAQVRQMAAKLHFPVGLLGSAWAGDYGRIWHCPVSFVIDRNGRLADNGWDDSQPTWTNDRLHRIVDPLLLQQV